MTKILNKILDVSIIVLLFAILFTISCKYNKEDFIDIQDLSILENFNNEDSTAVSDLLKEIEDSKKKNTSIQEQLDKLK